MKDPMKDFNTNFAAIFGSNPAKQNDSNLNPPKSQPHSGVNPDNMAKVNDLKQK